MMKHIQTVAILLLATLGLLVMVQVAGPNSTGSNRKFGAIFNSDNSNILYAVDPAKPTEVILEDYRRALNHILEAKPGVLAQNVGMPDPVIYRSTVATCTC